MSKRLILILALAFVVGLCATTYAAVQNVKVSGDILLQGIMRADWTLRNNTPDAASGSSNWGGDKQSYLLRGVRVRVDADLTDNVSATVRLLSEGAWGNTEIYAGGGENDDEVMLDLAYATLKEFLYAPMTLVLGRQELMFGNGMVVGDPDTNGTATGWGGTTAVVMANNNSWFYTPAPDLSLRKAFDAIKVILDYDPLVITGIYAKVIENDPSQDDDTTLFGMNAGYAFSETLMGEAYWFAKNTGRKALDTAMHNKVNRVDTVGFRLAKNELIENLSAQVEFAGQFGVYNPIANPNDGTTKIQRRRAWAGQAIATYNLKKRYSPVLSAIYAFYSGERRTSATVSNESKYHGWDPMFENQTLGHIVNALMVTSNCHIASLSGKMKPIDDVTVGLDYIAYWLHRRYADRDTVMLNGLSNGYQYMMSNKRFLGQELDLSLVYDYTEDVQFGLLAGMFLPGKAFNTDYNNTATELIGSMKVTF